MDEPSRDVVILGAGFSKAVHDAFPLLSELGARVLPCLENDAAPSTQAMIEELRRGVELTASTSADDGRTRTFDFEAWLSRLAVDQPYLSHAENDERRALFARAEEAIRNVLLEATKVALDGDPPSATWLYQLLRVLEVRGATIITMNYDTIIERLEPRVLWPWGSAPARPGDAGTITLTATRLFGNLPPTLTLCPEDSMAFPSYSSIPYPRPTQPLRLIKLHGSIDWFAARRDTTGEPLIRWAPTDEAGASDHPPGREPFLVPPDANKSHYYDNPILRELWAQARSALKEATRVILIGYSLPATDTTFAGLLADAISAPKASVKVVDRDPSPVIDRLRSHGIEATPVEGGADAVVRWTEEVVRCQSRLTAQALRSLATHLRAYESMWHVQVVTGSSDPQKPGHLPQRLVATGEQLGKTFVLNLCRPGEGKCGVPQQLTAFLPRDNVDQVVVKSGSLERPVIAYDAHEPQEGYLGNLVMLPLLLPGDHFI